MKTIEDTPTYTVQDFYADLQKEFPGEAIKGRTFDITSGLDRVVPYLAKLSQLEESAIELIDIGKGITYNDTGNGFKIVDSLSDLQTVMMSPSLHFGKKVYLYSVYITDPFFDYSTHNPTQGAHLLPMRMSDAFRPFRSIIVDIDVERMWDLRDDDPLIIKGGEIQNFVPESTHKKDKMKRAIISEFLEKLDYLFDMPKHDVMSNSIHDVEKTGRVLLRVAPGCAYVDRSRSIDKDTVVYKEAGKRCLKQSTIQKD